MKGLGSFLGNPKRTLFALVVIAGLGLMVGSVFADDLTSNNTLELDGNIQNNAAPGTDWGPTQTGAGVFTPNTGICKPIAGVTTGNGYIDENSAQPNIAIATCDGDSFLAGASGATYNFGPDNTYFASNKDIQDITGSTVNAGPWGCVQVNNPTPKDEILNAYAGLGTIVGGANQGDTALFMGFERGKNNGTSYQAVWFLKNAASCVGPGTGQNLWSGGPHASWAFDPATKAVLTTCNAAGVVGAGALPCTGDLLLLINFTGGGGTATVGGFAWAPAQADVSGVLVTLDGLHASSLNFNGTDCQVTANATTDVCATTNFPTIPTAVPPQPGAGAAIGCIVTAWAPADQDSCTTGGNGQTTNTGGSPVLDSFQFFEGMVNLSDTLGFVPCFSTAVFEARTSASVTATLKDYVIGDFDTCGTIIVHKETDPNNSTQTFGYTTTGGLGTFNLRDDGNNVLGCDYNQSTVPTSDDCGTLGTKVFENVQAGNYSITENDPTLLNPPFDFTNLTCRVLSGTATVDHLPPGNNSNRTATITMGTLGVVECLYQNRQRGSILVKKVDEAGSVVPGAGFTFTATVGGVSIAEVKDGDAADHALTPAANDGWVCVDNVVFGTYSVTESTVPAGYFGDSAKTVVVSSPSSCAARIAAATPPSSVVPDATFVNKLGAILINKVDTKGNRVAGACFTITPSPATLLTTMVVCDKDATHNGAGTSNDSDNRTGYICVTGAKKHNGYTITESALSGYTLQSITPNNGVLLTTGVFDVTAASVGCDTSATPPHTPVVVTATNIPLSEITVSFKSLAENPDATSAPSITSARIECHTGLVSGPLLVPVVPDASPAAFDDYSETYTNLEPGTTAVPTVYTCKIEIDP